MKRRPGISAHAAQIAAGGDVLNLALEDTTRRLRDRIKKLVAPLKPAGHNILL
jgi:hypothetical protein